MRGVMPLCQDDRPPLPRRTVSRDRQVSGLSAPKGWTFGGLPVPCGRCTEIWSLTSTRPFSAPCPGEKGRACALVPAGRVSDVLLLDEPTNDSGPGDIALAGRVYLAVPQPVLFSLHDETLQKKPQTSSSISNRSRKKHECRYTKSRRTGYRVCRGPVRPAPDKQEQVASRRGRL